MGIYQRVKEAYLYVVHGGGRGVKAVTLSGYDRIAFMRLPPLGAAQAVRPHCLSCDLMCTKNY